MQNEIANFIPISLKHKVRVNNIVLQDLMVFNLDFCIRILALDLGKWW